MEEDSYIYGSTDSNPTPQPVPPEQSTPPLPTPPPSGGSRRKLGYGIGAAVAVAIVVVVLLLSGILPVGLKLGGGSVAPVTVTSTTLAFTPANNPCFTSTYSNRTPSTLPGGTIQVYRVDLVNDANGAARDCRVLSIHVTTPGFSLASANVPLNVPAGPATLLSITVNLPRSGYSGPLNLEASAAYVLPNITVKNQNGSYSPSSSAGPCGASPPSGAGFTGFGGSTYNDSIGFFVISPSQSCSITGVTTTTPGFTILSSDTPYPLPIDSFASVSFVIQVPPGPFSGNVTIVLELS